MYSSAAVARAMRNVGRYEILRQIGRGGMATVYLARQIDLTRPVALKELAGLRASDPSIAQRFLREARLAGSLNHPNVVTVYDYFEHDGTPYLAMEYLERGSLRPYAGRISLPQIGGVLQDLLAGLAHAEQHGIVHRDLKPENLLLTSEGHVKIVDFGIAKASNNARGGAFLTSTGITVGTPNYMSPEQAMAQEIGPWTDLYAVGIMAFEFFVGRPPFADTQEPIGIVMRQINEAIPPVSSFVNVDQGLSDWIEWLLSKDPAGRPQSAAVAWDILESRLLAILGPHWGRSARLVEPGGLQGGLGLAQPTPQGPSYDAAGFAPSSTAHPLVTKPPAGLTRDRTPSARTTFPLPDRGADSARTAAPVLPFVNGGLTAAKGLPFNEPGPRPAGPRRRRRLVAAALIGLAATAILVASAGGLRGGAPQGAAPDPQQQPISPVTSRMDSTTADLATGGAGQATTPDSATPARNGAAAAEPEQSGQALQAEAKEARTLARKYDRAASQVVGADDVGTDAERRLAETLSEVAKGYRDAAAAARRGDVAGYAAAIGAVAVAKQGVNETIDALGGSSPAPSSSEDSSSGDSSCAGDSASDDPSDDDCEP